MSRFIPYICQHLRLDQLIMLPRYKNDNPYYVVIWWKNIPLGELWLEAGEKYNTAFDVMVADAILPAVKHYTAGITGKKPANVRALINALSERFITQETIPPTCNASLVICTRNRAHQLRKCLASIQGLHCRPEEIIVVDNGTEDESTLNVVQLFPGVIYIREDRAGLDIARNTGARAATRPIVMYTDDDTAIDPLWAYHTVRTFDDPSVNAMTGLVLAGEIKTEAQYIFEKFWPFNRGYTDRRYDQQFFISTVDRGCPVWTIGAGANMAFRKSVFAQTGFFDERLDVGAAGCNGDSEMWYRILAAGGTIQYNPRAIVSHYHREEMSKLRSQIYYYMRGFTAAILIQHQRYGHKGNLRHLLRDLPRYYAFLITRGFPRYRGKFSTVFREVTGIVSGLFYFLGHRKNPSNTGV